jgi:hypothetical protein
MIVCTENEPNTEEPKTPCDATIQHNLARYATRNASPALRALIQQSEIAGYANFDPIIEPDGESL